MEFYACILGGGCLIACGIALFRLRPPDWKSDGELTEDHLRAINRWAVVQRTVRILNNLLLIAIGGGIIASGFVPRGQAWMLVWMTILVLLLVCILLAMIDAFSSMAGYRRALPEAARRSFTDKGRQADTL